jgi:hypothetical protein
MYAIPPGASAAPHFSHSLFSSNPILSFILQERLQLFNDGSVL